MEKFPEIENSPPYNQSYNNFLGERLGRGGGGLWGGLRWGSSTLGNVFQGRRWGGHVEAPICPNNVLFIGMEKREGGRWFRFESCRSIGESSFGGLLNQGTYLELCSVRPWECGEERGIHCDKCHRPLGEFPYRFRSSQFRKAEKV